MKKRGVALACLLPLVLLGCAAFAVSPVSGFLYSDVKAPLSATAYPSAPKQGTSSCTSILGIIATGDCSISAAMKQGGVTRIHHVDYHTSGVLGIVATYRVIVYGE